MTALFVLYVAVFTYLADWYVPVPPPGLPGPRRALTAPAPGSYGIFASSALAGQSLCRTSRPSFLPCFRSARRLPFSRAPAEA